MGNGTILRTDTWPIVPNSAQPAGKAPMDEMSTGIPYAVGFPDHPDFRVWGMAAETVRHGFASKADSYTSKLRPFLEEGRCSVLHVDTSNLPSLFAVLQVYRFAV